MLIRGWGRIGKKSKSGQFGIKRWKEFAVPEERLKVLVVSTLICTRRGGSKLWRLGSCRADPSLRLVILGSGVRRWHHVALSTDLSMNHEASTNTGGIGWRGEVIRVHQLLVIAPYKFPSGRTVSQEMHRHMI